MVEKINRLGLKDCEGHLKNMLAELRSNKDEFLNGGFILDFEREWVGMYVEF
jgi:hypothetical protein